MDNKQTPQEKLIKLFELYFNDFLTVPRFAEYLEVSEHKARFIICAGRALREDRFGDSNVFWHN